MKLMTVEQELGGGCRSFDSVETNHELGERYFQVDGC
jgi:hypothetical protein